jgi:hypothetical protein
MAAAEPSPAYPGLLWDPTPTGPTIELGAVPASVDARAAAASLAAGSWAVLGCDARADGARVLLTVQSHAPLVAGAEPRAALGAALRSGADAPPGAPAARLLPAVGRLAQGRLHVLAAAPGLAFRAAPVRPLRLARARPVPWPRAGWLAITAARRLVPLGDDATNTDLPIVGVWVSPGGDTWLRAWAACARWCAAPRAAAPGRRVAQAGALLVAVLPEAGADGGIPSLYEARRVDGRPPRAAARADAAAGSAPARARARAPLVAAAWGGRLTGAPVCDVGGWEARAGVVGAGEAEREAPPALPPAPPPAPPPHSPTPPPPRPPPADECDDAALEEKYGLAPGGGGGGAGALHGARGPRRSQIM